MLTAASELTPGVSTLQETDGFRAALKPFDSSCSLRVLSESDKNRPRKSVFPGLGVLWWRRVTEAGACGEVQAPGVGTPHLSHWCCLPPPPCSGGSGCGLPTSSEG